MKKETFLKLFNKKLLIAFLLIIVQNTFAQNSWYVNDASPTGDIYCTGGATGNDLTNQVNNPNKPSATVADAIGAAAAGDVIYIDTGNYSEHTIAFNKGVTIIGAGIDKTIFQRASGIVRFGTISVSNVKLKNIKILNYNQTADGIALNISASAGDLTGILFEGVWIDKSTASGGGGAISIFSSVSQSIAVDFKNTLITCSTNGNYGSAIYIVGNKHRITIDKCHFESNGKATAGGALSILGTNSTDATKTLVTVSKTTFKNNFGLSNVNGGAIYVNGAQLNISESCFNGNTTGGLGTAIAGSRNSKIYVTNCNFENNTAGKAQIYTSYAINDPATSAGGTI